MLRGDCSFELSWRFVFPLSPRPVEPPRSTHSLSRFSLRIRLRSGTSTPQDTSSGLSRRMKGGTLGFVSFYSSSFFVRRVSLQPPFADFASSMMQWNFKNACQAEIFPSFLGSKAKSRAHVGEDQMKRGSETATGELRFDSWTNEDYERVERTRADSGSFSFLLENHSNYWDGVTKGKKMDHERFREGYHTGVILDSSSLPFSFSHLSLPFPFLPSFRTSD